MQSCRNVVIVGCTVLKTVSLMLLGIPAATLVAANILAILSMAASERLSKNGIPFNMTENWYVHMLNHCVTDLLPPGLYFNGNELRQSFTVYPPTASNISLIWVYEWHPSILL